ncbi:M36 family metallopeptidase [Rubrivirga sp. IMCC45206]|uniref:M36 family metallopeptidase n=1 Tax=Rubrivirga sp. IMCC45206 TaxID=3391614 RepID=UPI00398F94C3
MTRFLLASALALGLAASSFAQSSPLSPSAEQAALDYLRATADASAADLADLATDGHESSRSGLSYVYVQQRRSGIDVVGGTATVAVDPRNNVVHAAGALVRGLDAPGVATSPSLSASAAVAQAAALVGASGTPTAPVSTEPGAPQRTIFGEVAGIPVEARLVYMPDGKNPLRLAWEALVPTADAQHAWVVRVDAGTGAELGRFDMVVSDAFEHAPGGTAHSAATPLAFVEAARTVAAPALPAARGASDEYRVFPQPFESPNHSGTVPPGDGRTLEADPADGIASPFGWHDTDGTSGAEHTVTWGNNVRAYQDRADDNTGTTADSPDGGAGLSFDFPVDFTMDPSTYTDAAVTNLFYWNNVIHDVLYQYGFDEAAGNFQENNYGNGGDGADWVRAEAQDGADTGKTNNANMFTPSDGSPPRMQMFEWTTATPRIDGDFDAGIIVHEYVHGLSNRLTGGRLTTACLNNAEQMGEGWSDWYGLMFTQQVGDTGPMRRGIGTYALAEATDGPGIRPSPYSTDFAENAFTYGDLPPLAVPHGVGFVWATMLWEMTWELIDDHGWDADIWDAAGTAGNQIALNLVTDAMKLQPCNPGFVDGRDAILAADAALYPDAGNPGQGVNFDAIWEAFARRGLGFSADQGSPFDADDGVEAFDLPITSGIVEITPESFAFNVFDGGTASGTATISNTGSPGDGIVAWEASITNYAEGGDELGGGPDAYGYIWTDSNDPGGPAVNFQDISGTGTPIAFSSSDDGSAVVALPFAFPFYGVDQTDVRVATNGYLTFGTDGSDFSNDPIPNTNDPNDLIAPYWDDLHLRSGAGYYETLPDGRFVVQWTNFGRFSPSSGEDHTFQAILSDDGDIEFQYATITTAIPTSHTTGIENADASIGLQVWNNQPGVVSDYAVLIEAPYLWASVSPTSGSIAEGESDDLLIEVDAGPLPPGIYTADLVITTNDPAAAETVIPITMTVADDGISSIVIDGGRGPRYLGSPVLGLEIDDLAEQNLVRGVPGYFPFAEPNLWTSYDNSTGQWVPSTGTGEKLRNGKAFRWYFLDRDGVGDPNVSVSVALPFELASTRTPNEEDTRIALDTDGPRFNHLANPFDRALDLTGYQTWPGANGIKSRRLYTYNDGASAWQTAPDEIQPWEAFRFRAKRPRPNGNPRNLTIPFSATEFGPARTAETEEVPEIAFALTATSESGRALADRSLVIEFDAAGSAAFTEDEDMEKFQPPARAYALIGARVGGVFATHDVRPFTASEIPLAVETRGAEAEMTLRWDAETLPAGLPVVLVDLATGEEIDTRMRSSYTFRAVSQPAHEEAPLNDLADGDAATDRFVLRIGDAMASAGDVTELALDTPAPNPSAGTARIGFAMPDAGNARVVVYDVRGRQVAVLADGQVGAGRHEATLDSGALAAGVYVVRLEALGQVIVRQAVVVR